MFTRSALAAVTVIALTAVATAKPVTLSTETNLRKAPGTKSELISPIPKGSTIEIGECDAGWCKVTFNGVDGYAVQRNLGAAPPPARQADLHRLRQGYEDQFDDQPQGQQNYRSAGRAPQRYAEDDYYDDDDGAPVVYGRPGYVAGPPPVYYGYYPYPRPYWRYGYGYGPYWRRW